MDHQDSQARSLPLVPQIQQLSLDPEVNNEFLDPSFHTRRGIIMQFINNNCPGGTSVIGGKRLNLADVQRLPAYLSKHKTAIRSYAMHLLQKHLIANQCSVGVNEALSPEDFGMSFSLASLSPRATGLNPNNRNEGPMFFAAYPGLTEEVFLGTNDDGTPDSAHVVNVYVHLLESNKRRHLVLRKIREDKAKQEADATNTPPNKKPRTIMMGAQSVRRPYQQYQDRPFYDRPNTMEELKSVKESLTDLSQEVRRLNAVPSYPPLPEARPLPWPPADTVPELPDDI